MRQENPGQLKFDTLGKQKAFIGMLHLGTMPGTPFYEDGSYQATLDAAVEDAVALQEGGATGCLVQTVDRVYSTKDEADPTRIAAVANIVQAIHREVPADFQIGVQIMRHANKASLGVARVSGGSFVRVGALIGATLTPWGWVEADPHDVQAYRRYIGAWDIALIAEIASMHFNWSEKPLKELAWSARYVGADAVSIGDRDVEKTIRMIEEIKTAHPDLPVILAGYTNHDNAAQLFQYADGAYVGSCLEKGGWAGRISRERVEQYAEIISGL
ncbi:MAG: BtpA/SgcQ family protein [Chloroflexota bacterium]